MARFQLQLLALACFGVATSLASFQTDVVAKVSQKNWLNKLPSFLKNGGRRLGMAECMAGPCAPKLAEIGDDSKSDAEKMALMCPLIECLKSEADCKEMLDMLANNEAMPKGMIGCLCDSGCDLTAVVSMGEAEGAAMIDQIVNACPTLTCMSGADQCKDFNAQPQFVMIGAMSSCICGADQAAIVALMKGTAGKGDTGPCKDAPKKAGDDGEEELDICKIEPDGACARAIYPGWKALQGTDACADAKKAMNAGITEDDMKCATEMEAAVDAAVAAEAEAAPAPAAADFAQLAAVPPASLGLLLTTAAAAMAAL